MKQNDHEVKGGRVTETKDVFQKVMITTISCSTEVKEKVLDKIY